MVVDCNFLTLLLRGGLNYSYQRRINICPRSRCKDKWAWQCLQSTINYFIGQYVLMQTSQDKSKEGNECYFTWLKNRIYIISMSIAIIRDPIRVHFCEG